MSDAQGFGIAPFGMTPFGYGTPATAERRASGLHVNGDGMDVSARLIDRGDYVLDDDGRFVGMTGVAQKVYLALLTVRGSSIVDDLGQSFSEIKVIGENVQVLVTDRVNQALSSLVRSGEIEVQEVIVSNEKNRLLISVTWKDTASEAVRTTTA